MVQEAQLKRTESGLEPAGAGVERGTREPYEAYAAIPPDADVGYRAGWLPESA